MGLNKDIVNQIMAERGWMTIEDLRAEATQRGAFDEQFYATATENAEKAELRRVLKEKDKDGWPSYGNVITVDGEGEQTHLYKQEALFDEGDYRQVIRGHADTANYHINMAIGYQKRALERFNVQIPLPLEAFGRADAS